MNTDLVDHFQLDWGFLEAYLRQRDAHFATHWEWIQDVRRELEGNVVHLGGTVADPVIKMSERMERLRYQLLHERGDALDPSDYQAAELLDTLFGILTNRESAGVRHVRQVLEDVRFAREAIARLEWCLDPDVPLDKVLTSARRLTRESFGIQSHQTDSGSAPWPMFLYAPLYLSSYCVNHCLYCGFRFPEALPRRILSIEEAIRQVGLLVERGMRHILLVAGDYPQKTDVDFYVEAITAIRGHWPVSLAVEIAPQSTAGYSRLSHAGIIGVTLYQETYDWNLYRGYHPRGPKSHYDWRLEGLERAAEAGVRRLGLGILLGLADPVSDARAMIRHAYYLKERFPDRRIAFSLPRIHEGPAGFRVPHPVDDETLVRLYCGLRHAVPEAELVLSTREPSALRDLLAGTCITQLSAGSSTVPGGYDVEGTHFGDEHDGQFRVVDRRPVDKVIAMLRSQGHAIIWQPLEGEGDASWAE